MTVSKLYGNAIWTNHALERLEARRMPQSVAYKAFSSPDTSTRGKKQGTWEYTKTIQGHLITIIAKQNEKGEWIILSCWADPPFVGSMDIKKNEEYRKYKKAGFWGKFWLTFKKQLGL